jgi:hypothetical protein
VDTAAALDLSAVSKTEDKIHTLREALLGVFLKP